MSKPGYPVLDRPFTEQELNEMNERASRNKAENPYLPEGYRKRLKEMEGKK